MKKPRYASEIVSFVFLMIGLVFGLCALGCAVGFIVPSHSSAVQTVGLLALIFGVTAALFLVGGAALRAAIIARKDRHRRLLEEGRPVMGTVETVVYTRSVQYFTSHPYVLTYTFSDGSRTIRAKTALLWEKPAYEPGDAIRVYTDGTGKSTVDL